MGFFDRFNLVKYLDKQKYAKISQSETEAFVDAIVTTMQIDGDIDPKEERKILEASEKLNWRGDKPFGQYVGDISSTPEFIEEIAESIAFRMKTDWLQDQTFMLCSRIAMADDEIVETETAFLHALTKAFEFDSERQRLLIQQMTNMDR